MTTELQSNSVVTNIQNLFIIGDCETIEKSDTTFVLGSDA